MSALYLLLSTFGLVFALGLQSQLVNNGHFAGAFVNSMAIGACNLVLFKLAPNASGMEVAAYLAGGPFGIVASMWVYRRTCDGQRLLQDLANLGRSIFSGGRP
ncbi:hypothetical protein [Variovorax sp. RCC_210]|uniref:hypothetical protein n=1 Tax=Variovorax sp. RCC_210 TaxID=3239217 RepID=UPI003525E7C1